MLTTSHIIINATVFTKKEKDLIPAIIGAILPDIPLLIYLFLSRILPSVIILINQKLSVIHLSWSYVLSLFHSFPLLLVLLCISWISKKRTAITIASSMLLHAICDFFTHNNDAYRQFFPFSLFRFKSPLSAWDPIHFGNLFMIIEMIILAGCIYYLLNYVHSQRAKSIVIGITVIHIIGFVGFRTFML